MNNPIYFLISVVIGSSIILLLVRLNIFTSDVNYEVLQEEILMRTYITTQEIIKHHLKKVGYRLGNSSIVEADSTKIKFYFDDNFDGMLDLIEIKTTPNISATENPSDFGLLFRINNKEDIITPSGVTKFKLEFFDVNGNRTTEKMFIKSIKVTLRLESEIKVNGQYLFVEDQFLVKPRNLM